MNIPRIKKNINHVTNYSITFLEIDNETVK